MSTMAVVMYHYVRDVAGTRFPGLNAMSLADFRAQVGRLKESCEMATLESALAFLSGAYTPSRKMCLLTFDDGLAEHANEVTSILAEHKIQGCFFFPTACLVDGVVLPVHQNHVLMAHLGFDEYRTRVLARLPNPPAVSIEDAKKTYRWDTPDVAAFKYLINYAITKDARESLLSALFHDVFGDERSFASELYVSWDGARRMIDAGMVIGSHTHRHPVLSSCSPAVQDEELTVSKSILEDRLGPQALFPFCYPFGKPNTYDAHTLKTLADRGYACAFSTLAREAKPGDPRFEIPRIDPKDV